MQKLDLLLIGTPVIDYYAKIEDKKIQKKYKIEKGCTNYISKKEILRLLRKIKIIYKNAGDNAKNVGVAFKISGGGSAAYFGVVGKDEDGKFFKKSLKKYGIIDRTTTKIGISGKIICLIDEKKERTFIANLGVGISNLKLEKIPQAKIFFCTNITLIHKKIGRKTIQLIEALKKQGCKIAISLESKNLIKKNIKKTIEICKLADYLFLNKEELEAFGKQKKQILKLKAMIFLKLGGRGSVVIREGKIIAKQNAPKIKIKDLTGAGDFFAGGALAAIIKNKPLREVLKKATATAARVIKIIGVEP
ncbi:MAG: PfkB family carbohydrate kinase [Candidatus Anstonellaceae archaeon]